MTPLTPAQLHAKQLADTLAEKLPTSVVFDVTHARLLAEQVAQQNVWRNPAAQPLVIDEKA